MRAGQLSTRIEIIEATRTADAIGGYTTTWAIHKSVWADWREVTMKQKLEDGALDNPLDVLVKIRYDSTITADMRLRKENQQYEIIGLVRTGRANEELEISATKIRERSSD